MTATSICGAIIILSRTFSVRRNFLPNGDNVTVTGSFGRSIALGCVAPRGRLGWPLRMRRAAANQRMSRKRASRKWSLRDCCEVFKAAGTFLKGLAALLAAIAALLAALTHWF